MQQLKLGGILLPQQIIDLSTPMEKNNGEIAKFKMKQTKHKEGGDLFGRRQAFSRKETLKQTLLSIYHYLTGQRRITSKTFPDREFLNQEIITASTHTATHFDAPLHFGSKSERKPAPSIDEIPVEWCFGDGVLLDMRFKEPGEFITSADIDHELRRIQYELKPLDIVIIWTGAEQYWGKNEYLYNLLKEPLELSSYCRKFTLTVEFGQPPIVEQEHEAKVYISPESGVVKGSIMDIYNKIDVYESSRNNEHE